MNTSCEISPAQLPAGHPPSSPSAFTRLQKLAADLRFVSVDLADNISPSPPVSPVPFPARREGARLMPLRFE